MKKPNRILVPFMLVFILLSGCQPADETATEAASDVKGKLFIIGGGSRPPALIERLISESGVRDSGYVLVLPMASALEDTAIFYSSLQFTKQSIEQVYSVNSTQVNSAADSVATLVRSARLIYISGGAQDRFMASIQGTGIMKALHDAYMDGATIAGTSAGAAVMSKQMITGDQKKHPVYTGNFETIEANNIELEKGLGLMSEAIIDQHFIRRQRLNRLISVCLENPALTGIGIDESTALLVKEGHGEVIGESQIIVLQHQRAETKIVNGLLGGEELWLSVFLPGDTLTGDFLRALPMNCLQDKNP